MTNSFNRIHQRAGKISNISYLQPITSAVATVTTVVWGLVTFRKLLGSFRWSTRNLKMNGTWTFKTCTKIIHMEKYLKNLTNQSGLIRSVKRSQKQLIEILSKGQNKQHSVESNAKFFLFIYFKLIESLMQSRSRYNPMFINTVADTNKKIMTAYCSAKCMMSH